MNNTMSNAVATVADAQFAPSYAAPAAPITYGGSVQQSALQTREQAEIQSMMVMAKQFPRDEMRAIENIKRSCQRPTLAKKATYTYSKGGSDVSGPSIHLAKAIMKCWGNGLSGIRELEQRTNAQGVTESLVETFALDLETNYKEIKQFSVPHIRNTRKGTYRIEDAREVYELVANMGARRERACILSVIPQDIVDIALEECQRTLEQNFQVTDESIKAWLDAFAKLGVSKAQIEKRLQRRANAESMTPANLVNLQGIYNSIRDGMSTPAEWFEPEETSAPVANASGNAKAAAALNAKAGTATEPTANNGKVANSLI